MKGISAKTQKPVIKMINPQMIFRGAHQPRKNPKTDLAELVESINRIGLLQPPKIKPRGRKAGTFELIDGERRLHAIKKLQWNIIPCIVEDVDDETAWEQALASNIVRTDLSPTERIEAYGYWVDLKLKQKCEEYKQPGKYDKEPLRKLVNFLNKKKHAIINTQIKTALQTLPEKMAPESIRVALSNHISLDPAVKAIAIKEKLPSTTTIALNRAKKKAPRTFKKYTSTPGATKDVSTREIKMETELEAPPKPKKSEAKLPKIKTPPMLDDLVEEISQDMDDLSSKLRKVSGNLQYIRSDFIKRYFRKQAETLFDMLKDKILPESEVSNG